MKCLPRRSEASGVISSIALRLSKNLGSFNKVLLIAQLSPPGLIFLPRTTHTASIVNLTPDGGVYIPLTSATLSFFSKLRARLAFYIDGSASASALVHSASRASALSFSTLVASSSLLNTSLTLAISFYFSSITFAIAPTSYCFC